ncbi:hypothetical protein [Methylobacterium sp. CM6247]
MNLYYIKAEFAGDGCIENQNLWIRADSEDRALELWDAYYAIVDTFVDRTSYVPGPVTRAEAKSAFDCGFQIDLQKTYAVPAPAEGPIDWDEVKRLTVTES